MQPTPPPPDAGDAARRAQLQQALGPDYAVGELLGKGGFAEVYAATDLRLKRQIAVKVLRSDLVFTLAVLERFRREAEAVAQLRHPNIVPIYDVGDRADLVFYTMPRISGESLRAVLEREGRVPSEEARRILREAALALQVAHEAGFVHRDIKPDNIMLDGPERRVLLMDFGVAKVLAGDGAQITGAGVAVGTPHYMSPEQASGDPSVDHRSDLYALGVVGYQMLAGRTPFTGASFGELMVAHIQATPEDVGAVRPDAAPDLAAAVMRCLAKSPDARWPTAAALAAALAGGGTVAPAPAARGLSRRGALIGAVLAVSLVGVGVLLQRAREPDRLVAASGASVAVLYFDNLSRDSNDLYLAEGLGEEITSRLSALGRVQVKSRSAVRRAQAAAAGDLAALGRGLGVRFLVEGSVRRAGRRVRVAVSLVNAADGFRVWGQEFDRATTDLLAVEVEIARDVATMIAGRLQPQERASLAAQPTQSPEAYDHFLRANHYLTQRGPRPLARAIAEYQEALRLDSSFTQALARVALSYAVALWWGWPVDGIGPDALLARGLAATDRILARDSGVADAWVARGFLLTFRHPRTYQGVEEAFRRALEIDPDNLEALQQYAWVKSTTGDDSAAARYYRRILELEPDRPVTWSALAWHVEFRGRRYATARRLMDSALAIDPSAFFLYPQRALARLLLGDTTGALADGEAGTRLSPPGYPLMAEGTLAEVEARSGRRAATRARLTRLLSGLMDPARPTPLEALSIVPALVALGERDRALAFVERVQPRGAALWFYLRFPAFDPIRADRRFQRVVAESRPAAGGPI